MLEILAVVAVHEAGHALVYALLFKKAPVELKINLASFQGGYVIPSLITNGSSKQQMLDMICVKMAGTVAESIVFGETNRYNGNSTDLDQATKWAARYVRIYGFDGFRSRIAPITAMGADDLNTNIESTNPVIENIISTQYDRAQSLISSHQTSFQTIVDEILSTSTISPQRFREIVKEIDYDDSPDDLPGYARMWKNFKTSARA